MTPINETNPLANRYKKEGDRYIIEVVLDNPKHLFDRKDPSPLKGRDLNEDVAAYIINSLRELPMRDNVQLKIYFRETTEDPKFSPENVAEAIRTFFIYEEYFHSMELKMRFKRGFQALFVGLTFLFLCILFPHLAKKGSNSLLWQYAQEGFNVLGWVSMWYPIHILLYEWWPIKAEKKIYHRASQMQVIVTSYGKSLSAIGHF